jgi:hypothetical protein
MGRARGYKRFDKARRRLGHEVKHYAYTAVRPDGAPDQNLANWQLLSTHYRRTRKGLIACAKPRMEVIVFNLSAEAARLFPTYHGRPTGFDPHSSYPKPVASSIL